MQPATCAFLHASHGRDGDVRVVSMIPAGRIVTCARHCLHALTHAVQPSRAFQPAHIHTRTYTNTLLNIILHNNTQTYIHTYTPCYQPCQQSRSLEKARPHAGRLLDACVTRRMIHALTCVQASSSTSVRALVDFQRPSSYSRISAEGPSHAPSEATVCKPTKQAASKRTSHEVPRYRFINAERYPGINVSMYQSIKVS